MGFRSHRLRLLSAVTAGLAATSFVAPTAAHAGVSIPKTFNGATGVDFQYFASVDKFCISATPVQPKAVFYDAATGKRVGLSVYNGWYSYYTEHFWGTRDGSTLCGKFVNVRQNQRIKFSLESITTGPPYRIYGPSFGYLTV